MRKLITTVVLAIVTPLFGQGESHGTPADQMCRATYTICVQNIGGHRWVDSSTMSEVSSTEPDWSREAVTGFWQPSRQLLKTIRGYQLHAKRAGLFARLRQKLYVLEYRFWSVVTGADIPINCQIGGGLMMPHPNGIVIHVDAKIGVNCMIFQQVTLGTKRGGGAPTLEGHVDVGAGAKILGGVVIPAHSEVKANTVVSRWPT